MQNTETIHFGQEFFQWLKLRIVRSQRMDHEQIPDGGVYYIIVKCCSHLKSLAFPVSPIGTAFSQRTLSGEAGIAAPELLDVMCQSGSAATAGSGREDEPASETAMFRIEPSRGTANSVPSRMLLKIRQGLSGGALNKGYLANDYAEAAGAFHGDLGKLLSDPAIDVVYISTTNELHRDQAVAAAAAARLIQEGAIGQPLAARVFTRFTCLRACRVGVSPNPTLEAG